MYFLFARFCKLFQWWYAILVELRRRVAVDQGPQITPPEIGSAMPANDEQQAFLIVDQPAAATGGDSKASMQCSPQTGGRSWPFSTEDEIAKTRLCESVNGVGGCMSPTVPEGHERIILANKGTQTYLPITPQSDMLKHGEVQPLSSVERQDVAVQTTPVSAQRFDQKDEQKLGSGKDTMDFNTHILSVELLRQADERKIPIQTGSQTGVMQLREIKYGAYEREIPAVLTEIVSMDERLPTIANECSQGRDSQELPLPTREDLASISLRKSKDCDEELGVQAPPKSDEAASGKKESHVSSSGCEQRTDELGSSPRAGDQTVIVHVPGRGSSAEQTPRVLEDVNSTDGERQDLTCECTKRDNGTEEVAIKPSDKKDLPEGPDNVITCLLNNKYNRGVKDAQAWLKKADEWRAEAWEAAADKADVELEQRRVGVVYADEKAMDDIKVEVPRQVKYVGTNPAIPPSLADTPCADLGVDGTLQYLNCLLRTTYTLDGSKLSSILQRYAERGFDFGLAYGHLRHWWFEDFDQLQETMREREAKDKERRERAIDGAYVVDRKLPPRRAWDLYSNRVLPWWVLREWDPSDLKWVEKSWVDAVSHSWVHPTDRQRAWTPINGYEWPVPIPRDTTLDQIRVELLNVGRELVWLDVLCLWQDGPDVIRDNTARSHEWKLDVPTIGNIYQSQAMNSVVVYFSGLGRRFRIGSDLDGERHWLNRAWTLQEFNKYGIIGGLVDDSFTPSIVNNQVNSDHNVVCFFQRLQAASNNRSVNSDAPKNLVFSVLAAMRPRYAAHGVDKVGGITHILAGNHIPTYTRSDEDFALEDAWSLLVAAMDDHHRADLFFFYPVPGKLNGKYAWYPSWDQLTAFLPLVPSFKLSGQLTFIEGQFQCRGWLIEGCQIQGFARPSSGGSCRRGKLQFVHTSVQYSVSVIAHHQEPIADDERYVLKGAGARDSSMVVWVVGKLHYGKLFEKLSVLRTEDSHEFDLIQKLKLTERSDSLPVAPGWGGWRKPRGQQRLNSASEKLRALSCRCSEPVREEGLTLPNGNNVIDCLLRNMYNCDVNGAQAQLKEDEERRWEGWREAAGRVGVGLGRGQVGVVYADEKAMDDLEVEVPRQVKYVGTSPAIPASLADTPCADLGVDGMLQYLNHLLRTTYPLDRDGLASVLQSYIERGFDFGLAYGHLRHCWFEDLALVQHKMWFRAAADKARRDRAIDGKYIVNRSLPPRRAWDLYSNRVLPWWVFREWDRYNQEWEEMESVDAISHSWVHFDDRQSVWTPINGRKWPVPIPKDVTLDRIRVELLNVGIEVVWLDVLCLWQEGVTEDDAERLHEWELDVPIIGSVYQSFYPNTVVTYFNGLGRPFRIGDLDNKRHWLNRAWNLQEFDKDGIIGGLVPGSFPPPMINNRVNSDLNVVCFYRRLQAASNNDFRRLNVVLSVLAAMGPRHAAHVVDKVGGITHVLTMGRIPKYIRGNESSAAENAWNLLIPVMDNNNLADLFFLYPARGDGKYAWCPSWAQVNGPLPPVPSFFLSGSLEYSDKASRFGCQGWLIEQCQIQGFTKPNPGGRCRTGTLRVVHDGAEHSFTVAAHHQEPISDGSYALVGDRSWDGHDVVVWAVGTLSSDKRFEKVSVLRTEDEDDIERLQNLGLIAGYDDYRSKSSVALV